MNAKRRLGNRFAGALVVAFGLGFVLAVGIPFSAGDTPGAECEGLSEEPCYDLSETLPPDLGAAPAIGINMETAGTEDGDYAAPGGSTELFGCEEPYCPNMLNEPPDPELVGIFEATADEQTTTNGPDSSGVRVCQCDVPGWPACSLVTVLNNGLQDASPALQRCFDALGSRWGYETMEIPAGFYALRTPVRLVNTTPFLKTLKVQGVPLHSAPCFNQLGAQTNACAILIAAPEAVGWGGDIRPWGKSIGLLSVEGQDLQISHVGVHGNRGARINRPVHSACRFEGIPGKYKGVNIGVTCDRCQFLNGYSGYAMCASGLLWTNYHNAGNYRQTRWGMVRANLFTHNGASHPEEIADGATFYSASGIPGYPFYVGLNGSINNSDVAFAIFGARDGAIFEHNGVIQTTSSPNVLYAAFVLEARPFRSPAQGFNDFTGAFFRYNWVNSSYGPGISFDPVHFGFQVGSDPGFSPFEDALATGGFIHDNHFYEVKQPVNVARSIGVRVNGVNATWIDPRGCPALGVPYGHGSGCAVPGWLFRPIPLTSCGDGRHPTSRFNVSPGRGPLLGYPPIQGSQLAAGSVAPTTYWNWENCY